MQEREKTRAEQYRERLTGNDCEIPTRRATSLRYDDTLSVFIYHLDAAVFSASSNERFFTFSLEQCAVFAYEMEKECLNNI